MKKILALVMSVLLVFTFAACGGKKPTTDIKDSYELLSAVWKGYAEKDVFPVGDALGIAMNEPGALGVENTDVLDSTLGFPAASVSKIDNAASMVHMMNLNTFTSGVYHVVDHTELDGLVAEIKNNIMNRQWMCGFPDKLVIITVDDLYIISAFGKSDLVDNFASYVAAAYPQAKTVVDEAIIV